MEIQSTEYYELDVFWAVAVTQGESKFKQHALSKRPYNCKGLKQLSGSTESYCRQALENRIKDTDVYSIEFNVWAGNLTLKTCLDWAGGNYVKAIEIYNVGLGNYRKGTREGVNRNYRHIKKTSILHSELKAAWREFPKFFR
jgi:soluble lytic murein transglycosylase-like protein